MTPVDVLGELWAAGVAVRLTDDGEHLAVKGPLSQHHRAVVLAHKPDLVAFLAQARATTKTLIEAAMLACDHFGDGQDARNLMQAEVLSVPAHQRADLIEHFRNAYPVARRTP